MSSTSSSPSGGQCDASEYFEIRPPEGNRVLDTWIHPPVSKPNSRLILVGASGCRKRTLLRTFLIDIGLILTLESLCLTS